jgi:hypothetical protein
MMQNFITRPRGAFAKKLSIFLMATLLLACSAARFGYNNGEILSYWWLNRYVDFDAAQRPWVKKEIAGLFSWHRKTQLKGYAQWLTRGQKRIQGTVTETELLADYEDVKQRLLLMADKALPDLADLALSLQPQQIANIEKKFASNNNDYRKEFLRGDLEQRRRYRYKKTLQQAEDWFGGFSREQEQRIQAASDARLLNNEWVLADRVQWQKALIDLLKKIQAEKPGREATMAMLKDYVAAAMNRFDDQSVGTARMVALIVNDTTPAQKERFIKTSQQWIDDFEALAK